MPLTSGASVISCVFHIQHTSQTMKSDAGPANRQPLTLSRQDGCVCSATWLVLAHLKTTHVLYEQPSADLVDQGEPGFERLSSTFSSIISESSPPGSVRRTVSSGSNSWRRLCPVKDAPPDDDDEWTLPWQPILGKICEMTFIQHAGILKRDALLSCGCTHQ